MKQSSLISTIIFYNKSTGIQNKLAFSSEFRHCNIITYDGVIWLMIDFDLTGLVTRKLNVTSGDILIKSLHILKDVTAIINLEVHERHKSCWKPFIVRSCNEICRYTAGINIGFTFNPRHLYGKLLKYQHISNYELLSHWRRSDG
jgi:hypothetical protein